MSAQGEDILDGVMYGDLYEAMKQEACDHIAANDPASVLRRCATDRQLLNLHGDRSHSCPAKGANGFPDEWTEFGRADICPVVHLLAEGYGWNSETSHADTGARQTPPTEGDQVT